MFQTFIGSIVRLHRVIIPGAVLALGCMIVAVSSASTRPCHDPPPQCEPAAAAGGSAHRRPVLLADDIIRRLRRMGLNFNKTRLPHPYDPDDWIC